MQVVNKMFCNLLCAVFLISRTSNHPFILRYIKGGSMGWPYRLTDIIIELLITCSFQI